MVKRLTTEEFIEKSKVIHGEFYQLPSEHLREHECNESALEKEIKNKLQDLSIEYIYQKKV